MQFLFIHSACVAVALLLPCALCDRITLPLPSIVRTSILISTKKRIETEAEGEIQCLPIYNLLNDKQKRNSEVNVGVY